MAGSGEASGAHRLSSPCQVGHGHQTIETWHRVNETFGVISSNHGPDTPKRPGSGQGQEVKDHV